jgi:hypothetical protein
MSWMGVAILAAGSLHPRPLPLNECGAPVRTETGDTVEYDRRELESRACAALREGRARPSPSLPSSLRPGPAARALASYGSGIGLSNIVVAPVPAAAGWGPTEIYLGATPSTFGGNEYWHALRYSSARQTYEDVFVSERMPALLARLAVADIRGDARPEIVAALVTGQVLVYDQLSKRALPGFSTGLIDLGGLALADLDADGKAEVLATSPQTLRVFTGAGALAWEVPGAGGADVVVGQMDADAGLEIAVGGGSVVDAATRTVQWAHSSLFGYDLETADIDGDGMQELVASHGWYFVWAYDVDTRLPKWSIPMSHDIGGIRLANVDADPVIELLVGEGQWGSVLAFDTVTQVQEWAIPNPEHGITHVALGQTDGDGPLELLWGAGATSTGADHLYVASLATRAIEWESVHLDGPFLGPELGDVDGDGRPELVLASFTSNSGYDGGRVVVLDAATFALRAISPDTNIFAWVHDLKLRNADADPALEILVAAGEPYDGAVRILDFDGGTGTFSERWTNAERPFGCAFFSVELADLDADGALEVIAGCGREHTGAEGVFVYVFDLVTGLREWRTFQLGGYWSSVSGLQVLSEGGGHPELVARVGDESIYVFDGVTRAPVQIVSGSFSALGAASSPAGRSFLAGTTGGAVQRYDRGPSTYGLAASFPVGPSRIEGAHFVSKDGLLAVGHGEGFGLYRWGDPLPLWSSADYGAGLGRSLAADSRNLYTAGHFVVAAFSPRYPPAAAPAPSF